MTHASAEVEAGWSVSSSRAWLEDASAHQSYKDVLDRAMASKPLKDELVRLRTRLSDSELKRERERRRRRTSDRRLKEALTEVVRLRQQLQARPAENSIAGQAGGGQGEDAGEQGQEDEEDENMQENVAQGCKLQEGNKEQAGKEQKKDRKTEQKNEEEEDCGSGDEHEEGGQGTSEHLAKNDSTARRRKRWRGGSTGHGQSQTGSKSAASSCAKSPIKGTDLLSGATAAALMLERGRGRQACAAGAVTPPRLPRSTVRYPPTIRREARQRRDKLDCLGPRRSALATINARSRCISDI